MMKRVAKTEHYIDGMEVKGLKETKAMELLESGKRKRTKSTRGKTRKIIIEYII